jgi:hypothetical protein
LICCARYLLAAWVNVKRRACEILEKIRENGGSIQTTKPNQFSKVFMNDATQRPALPDHLSADVRSPHHHAAVFEHNVGIRFNDKERVDVEEYCISEGWVKVPAGKTLDRKGHPLLIKLKGKVEAYYK